MDKGKQGNRCVFHYDLKLPADMGKEDGCSMHDIMLEHDGQNCTAYFSQVSYGADMYLAVFEDGTDFIAYEHELELITDNKGDKSTMRRFTVYYKEVIMHGFEYQAASAEEAERMFRADADNGKLDFGDGEVVEGDIDRIEDTTENELYFNVYHFLLRVLPGEYLGNAARLIREIMADVQASSEYPVKWNDSDLRLAFARVVLKRLEEEDSAKPQTKPEQNSTGVTFVHGRTNY